MKKQSLKIDINAELGLPVAERVSHKLSGNTAGMSHRSTVHL